MHSYNVDPQRGVKEWQCRMNQLNGYTKYMPSNSLEKQDKVKEEFTEIKMQELLTISRVRNLEAIFVLRHRFTVVLSFASLVARWPGERGVSSSYTDKRDI